MASRERIHQVGLKKFSQLLQYFEGNPDPEPYFKVPVTYDMCVNERRDCKSIWSDDMSKSGYRWVPALQISVMVGTWSRFSLTDPLLGHIMERLWNVLMDCDGYACIDDSLSKDNPEAKIH